ncbi:MAG: M13 family metallopeptidase [Bacteroidia bacterium]|nr:M13 family metallopeptidase [Bacteroidia bacterium]MBP7715539.1 M13 family metallopeptidase [Bacteroidia bacterium]HOZ91418.1 M13 family metallopeptidase [Bacteroidia bacterium]HQW17471.1 M13 family metallopeptidase [Bacteroidia bacterium]HQW49049.1 M13 family metallopeptidase [Bacteroidia bacterium]
MKSKMILAGCAIALVSLYAFKKKEPGVTGAVKATAATKPIDINNFDMSVKPGDDFYQYVNGNWLKKNPLPASETRWGSFNVLDDITRERVRTILDETAAMKNVVDGSADQKIRDFYLTAMDTIRIEEMRGSPLKPIIEKINKIDSKSQLPTLMAELQRMGFSSFFNFYVGQDDKKSDQMIINLYQGGLGLPDRDYYLKDDKESVEIRQKYLTHVKTMFMLMGIPAGGSSIQNLMTLETELAKISRSRVELRDPEKNYNKMGVQEFAAQMTNFSINEYFKNFGVQEKEVIIGQPEFFKRVNEMIEKTSLDDIKFYLTWDVINSRASTLSSEFVKADFEFYHGVLSGAKEMRPRWKRVLGTMNGTMGELIGELYVKKYFTPQAKERVNLMVDNLISAYKERIKSRTWLEDQTKSAALLKLDKVMRKLAYPDRWRDYSKLSVGKDSYCDNVNRASEFWFQYNLSKLGKPVDKSEWAMSPQTINAYYNPGFNEIVFPAAIMQPPFFDPMADDAVNYGAMGAVIGHELTHGFDDQGCQYDAEGNLKNWWTEKDKSLFDQRAQKLVDQFNHYMPIDSLTINGKLTLGENIADLGGLTIAYAALQKTLALKPKVKIDGFTPEQRFFINFAQVWRNNIRPEELKKRLKTDPHSPGKFRANGTVRNMPEFYEAFGITKENKMYLPPDQRVEIW